MESNESIFYHFLVFRNPYILVIEDICRLQTVFDGPKSHILKNRTWYGF